MLKVLRVAGQTEPIEVTSRKQEGQKIHKCFVRLKEIGDNYTEYVAAVLGNGATVKYAEGAIVAADLSFTSHESQGVFYQDVLAREIVVLK
jgi:hypothetical protein